MSDERKRENEEEKLKDFFHNVIGIKSEAVLEVLAENSEICNLKARTLLMKENEKVDAISFLYKKGGLVKSYYEKSDGKKQAHCFAHFPGEALVGIMNLDKQITYEKYKAMSDKEQLKKIVSMPVHYLLESG